MKILNCLLILGLGSVCFAKEITTPAELLKTEFCVEFKCAQTSAFVTDAGEQMITYLLKKENADVELLAAVKGGRLHNLTLKSASHNAEISPVILTGYFTSLLGQKPEKAQVDKIVSGASVKSRKDEFMKLDTIKLGTLEVRAASVLKYQTVQTVFQ